jgi:hypothetical protein
VLSGRGEKAEEDRQHGSDLSAQVAPQQNGIKGVLSHVTSIGHNVRSARNVINSSCFVISITVIAQRMHVKQRPP